eukprot:1839538-Amphidinium_carterae.2
MAETALRTEERLSTSRSHMAILTAAGAARHSDGRAHSLNTAQRTQSEGFARRNLSKNGCSVHQQRNEAIATPLAARSMHSTL